MNASTPPSQGDCVVGVDVGTGSARAGVFDLAGRMLAAAQHDIRVFHAPGAIVEQSSNDIWRAVCTSVRGAVPQSGVTPEPMGCTSCLNSWAIGPRWPTRMPAR